MAVKLHVPNKSYEGYFGGVRFSRGVGHFEDEKLARELAAKFGYEIEELDSKPVEAKVDEPKEEVKESKPKRKSRKKGDE